MIEYKLYEFVFKDGVPELKIETYTGAPIRSGQSLNLNLLIDSYRDKLRVEAKQKFEEQLLSLQNLVQKEKEKDTKGFQLYNLMPLTFYIVHSTESLGRIGVFPSCVIKKEQLFIEYPNDNTILLKNKDVIPNKEIYIAGIEGSIKDKEEYVIEQLQKHNIFTKKELAIQQLYKNFNEFFKYETI